MAVDIDPDKTLNAIPEACREVERMTTVGLSGGQEVFEAGFCYGLVMAAWMSMPDELTCTGPQRTYDLILIYNAFLRDKPVWRTRSQVAAVQAAISDAFPCPKK